MVFVKLLGLIDLACAIVLFVTIWASYWPLSAVLAAYLVIKGLIFIKNFASIIDVLAGIYLIVTIFFSITIVSTIFFIYLGFKGYLSLRS